MTKWNIFKTSEQNLFTLLRSAREAKSLLSVKQQPSLTDPQMDMVEEESPQNLIEGAIHFQTSRGTHEPLQKLLQLLCDVLENKQNSFLLLLHAVYSFVSQTYCFYCKPPCLYHHQSSFRPTGDPTSAHVHSDLNNLRQMKKNEQCTARL